MPIIIIRSKTVERLTGTCAFEYKYVAGSRDSRGRLLILARLVSRKRAKKVIEKRGLVRAYSNEDGTIYDTEDRAFKALFPQGVKTAEEMDQIEKVDNL